MTPVLLQPKLHHQQGHFLLAMMGATVIMQEGCKATIGGKMLCFGPQVGALIMFLPGHFCL